MCHLWSREFLPFQSTWVHPQIFVEFMFSLFVLLIIVLSVLLWFMTSYNPFFMTSGNPFFMTSGNPFFMTSGNPFSVFKHFLRQWNQMTTYLLTNDWDELTSENDVHKVMLGHTWTCYVVHTAVVFFLFSY